MIHIYKGDDTIFGGVQKIAIDLRGVTMPAGYTIEAHLCGDVVASVTMPAQTIAVVFSAAETAKMACGLHYIRLVAFDTDGKRETFASIPLNVTTDASKTSGDYIVPAITAGLNPASKTALGVVRVGAGIEVAPDGTISVKGGGGGGTSDYNDLDNKPKINGVELSCDKSAADLGLADVGSLADVESIADNALSAALSANAVASEAWQKADEARGKAENAEGSAHAANEAADGALNVANDAEEAAMSAAQVAEELRGDVQSMRQDVDDAINTAQTAKQTADYALSTGGTAYNLASSASLAAGAAQQTADEHIADVDNPHGVTAEQVGAYTKTAVNNRLNQINSSIDAAVARIDALEETVGNANEILEGAL